MSTEKDRGTADIMDPAGIKQEILEEIPAEGSQKACEADSHKQGRGGRKGPGDICQHKDDTGHPHDARLRLRRL